MVATFINRSAVVFALWLACVGCTRQASGQTEKPRDTAIDNALAHAWIFLEARQSDDGAWRSDVYSPFKQGDALTALVLCAMQAASADRDQRAAIDRAREFLVAMVDEQGRLQPPGGRLAYGVYTAAGAVAALDGQHDERSLRARDAWLEYLLTRQLDESLAWQVSDAFYGGWGYADVPCVKPSAGEPVPPLAQPNLSATVYALAALHAVGYGADSPQVRKGLAFVRRCQNFSVTGNPESTFDDGGFFFIHDDPVRNKAGMTGIDSQGRSRFASYGSTTADGVLALSLWSLEEDRQRIAAGWDWIERHFSATSHPGAYAEDRQAAREALYFYYCHSLTQALTRSGEAAGPGVPRRAELAGRIAQALMSRQEADGSWVNAAVDVREDDPLVATSMAVRALATCKDVMAPHAGPVANRSR